MSQIDSPSLRQPAKNRPSLRCVERLATAHHWISRMTLPTIDCEELPLPLAMRTGLSHHSLSKRPTEQKSGSELYWQIP